MPTYYEMIKLAPTATPAEIEAAIESQYNQWRRLVTHHDPNVVNQADQALQTLETIRGTLTDAAKRAGYDAAIGVGGQVAGLADPEAVLRAAAPAAAPPFVPPLAGPTAQPQAMRRTDAWLCPKCQMANSVGVQFCARCGQKIGAKCPGCGELTELANAFCPHCGADKAEAFSKDQGLKAQQLRAEIEIERDRIARLEGLKSRAIRSALLGSLGEDGKEWKSLNSQLGCGTRSALAIAVMVGGCLGAAFGSSAGNGCTVPGAFLGILVGSLVAALIQQGQITAIADQRIAQHETVIAGLEQEIKALQGQKYPTDA